MNNGDVLRDAAIAGLGIALLPMFIAGPAIRAGDLSVINIGTHAAEEHIILLTPKAAAPRQSCAPLPIT